MLYNYLIKNSSKKHPVSRKQIFDYFEKEYGLKVSLHTFYADIAVIRSEAFNLDVEYDKHLFGGAGGYYVRRHLFEPDELRFIIDSIQSSKFLTQTTANSLSKRIRDLACAGDSASMNRPAAVSNRVRSMNESVVKEADRIYEAIAADEYDNEKFIMLLCFTYYFCVNCWFVIHSQMPPSFVFNTHCSAFSPKPEHRNAPACVPFSRICILW